MRAKQESCCFSGHRPEKLPWGTREEDPRCLLLKEKIMDAAQTAYAQGYRHFICGMARGCDWYFCEAVLELREAREGISVEAAIPWPGQANGWPEADRRRYQNLVERCNWQSMVSTHYHQGCLLRRDRYMVDHTSLLIAAFNGAPGGTSYTMRYALRRGLEIIDLHIETL